MFRFEITSPKLKVLSAISTNIASALLLAPFTVRHPLVLTTSLLYAILLVQVAVKIEELLEEV